MLDIDEIKIKKYVIIILHSLFSFPLSFHITVHPSEKLDKHLHHIKWGGEKTHQATTPNTICVVESQVNSSLRVR